MTPPGLNATCAEQEVEGGLLNSRTNDFVYRANVDRYRKMLSQTTDLDERKRIMELLTEVVAARIRDEG